MSVVTCCAASMVSASQSPMARETDMPLASAMRVNVS
jgi:hypothetical protein